MQSSQAPLCAVCKSFYANPATPNMCSGCYKKSLEKAIGSAQPKSASVVQPVGGKEEIKKADAVPATVTAKPVQVIDAFYLIGRQNKLLVVFSESRLFGHSMQVWLYVLFQTSSLL